MRDASGNVPLRLSFRLRANLTTIGFERRNAPDIIALPLIARAQPFPSKLILERSQWNSGTEHDGAGSTASKQHVKVAQRGGA